MGCAYPVKIINKNYESGAVQLWKRERYFFVPCGKCLSCQISKRTWLNTACNYEFNKYGIGSFTTLTYDNEHILKNWNEKLNIFTLCYKDFQDFMKRLRENLFRKYGFRMDFKYLAVGEYGGESGRIHFHVLFFGLDCRNNDLDIYNAWKNGICQNLPIKEGGINYVLKYLDKANIRRKEKVLLNDEEQPFLKHSAGLGKGFIEEHLDDIIKHNGTYDRGDGRRHSLPKYWLNKLKIPSISNYRAIKEQMVQWGYKGIKDYKKISKAEAINWSGQQTAIKEQQMIRRARLDGNAQEDFDTRANEITRSLMW